MAVDEQYFRYAREATTDFAAKRSESGEYQVLERDRPSGRIKVIADGLEPKKACKLRNEMIRASQPSS